jgi:fumarate hydratase subunit beta
MRVIEGGEIPAPAHTVYHCGPLVKKTNGFEVISAGPTTSARLNDYTREMAEKFDTRLFIGKGGMDTASSRVFEEFGCAYLAFTGGAGALAAQGIKEVKATFFEDLGMAEAIWQLEVEDFGPLVVAMDSKGGSLYK